MDLLIYFTDPVLRAPTIGSMFMCMAASLIGVIALLRKQSLIGETLSHAAYPGVIFGVLSAAFFMKSESDSFILSISILIGAFGTALLGLWCIHLLQSKLRVASDAALCFVLSSFFGIGLTLASRIQFTHTHLYQQIQVYLYGQAATMSDVHILIYSILALMILATICFLYKEIQVISLDRNYAKSLGIAVRRIDIATFILITLAVVIGIRSVGIVLMSAMLIAPAVAARQYTHRLSQMFILSACFGLISGFLGNYLSVEISKMMKLYFPLSRIALSTGPMIVLVASTICLFSLLCAPNRGLLVRLGRILSFRYQCVCENLLKALWRFGPNSDVSFKEITQYQGGSASYLKFLLLRLVRDGWVMKINTNMYRLTPYGYHRAARIIRLHRLWEVYLADYLGVGAERVHRSAEEMEHIITPELEETLTKLLNNPQEDPHHQPIPPKE